MSSTLQSKKPYNLFYCYADKDQHLLDKLEAQMSALKREGEIRAYHRRDISAGKNRDDELTKFMNRSSIILLLISPDFLHSDYNYSHEMAQAIQRSVMRTAIIIPIILRPCSWEQIPFGDPLVLSDYEVLPQNQKAVTTWTNRDTAFCEIAQAIRQAVQNLREYAEEIKVNQISPTH